MILKKIVRCLSGRIFICEESDLTVRDYFIECVEKQEIDYKRNPQVLFTNDKELIKANLVPYSERCFIEVSSQFGCYYHCIFCDASLPFRGNLTYNQILKQIDLIIRNSPEIQKARQIEISFNRMGEPFFNWSNVLEAIKSLKYHQWGNFSFLPCYNSIVPDMTIEKSPFEILEKITAIKERRFGGELIIQLSINSTNEEERLKFTHGNKVVLFESLIDFFNNQVITNKLINISFICSENWELDCQKLKRLDPQKFSIKLIAPNKTRRMKQNSSLFFKKNNIDYLKRKLDEISALGFTVFPQLTTSWEEEHRLGVGQICFVHLKGNKNFVKHKNHERKVINKKDLL